MYGRVRVNGRTKSSHELLTLLVGILAEVVRERGGPLTVRSVEYFLSDPLAVLSAPDFPAAIGALAVNPGHAIQYNQRVCGVTGGFPPLFPPAFTW